MTEDSQNETALVAQDVQLEKVKNAHGTGEVMRARNAQGRFVRTTTASATKDTHATQKFLAEVDPTTGKSRRQSLLEAAYDGALEAAKEPRALGNVVKVIEALDIQAGHAKVRDTMLSDQSHVHQPVRVVVIPVVSTMMNKEVIDGDKPKPEKAQPTFVDAEVISTNQP